MFLRKKSIVTLAAALTLAIGATAFAATADTAKTISAKLVPQDAQFTHIKDDGKEYDVHYTDAKTQTTYKVEVNKLTDKVTEIESKSQTDRGGASVKISENDVKTIVTKDFADAQIYKIKTENDHGAVKYEVSFNAGGITKGEYEINAETGNVMERKIQY